MDNYNASSRDYNDMSRSAGRDYYIMEQARIAKRNNKAQEQTAIALEKINILQQYKLKLISKEQTQEKIAKLEKQEEKKSGFFR